MKRVIVIMLFLLLVPIVSYASVEVEDGIFRFWDQNGVVALYDSKVRVVKQEEVVLVWVIFPTPQTLKEELYRIDCKNYNVAVVQQVVRDRRTGVELSNRKIVNLVTKTPRKGTLEDELSLEICETYIWGGRQSRPIVESVDLKKAVLLHSGDKAKLYYDPDTIMNILGTVTVVVFVTEIDKPDTVIVQLRQIGCRSKTIGTVAYQIFDLKQQKTIDSRTLTRFPMQKVRPNTVGQKLIEEVCE